MRNSKRSTWYKIHTTYNFIDQLTSHSLHRQIKTPMTSHTILIHIGIFVVHVKWTNIPYSVYKTMKCLLHFSGAKNMWRPWVNDPIACTFDFGKFRSHNQWVLAKNWKKKFCKWPQMTSHAYGNSIWVQQNKLTPNVWSKRKEWKLSTFARSHLIRIHVGVCEYM